MKSHGSRLILSLFALAALVSQTSAQTTFFGIDNPRVGAPTNSLAAEASFLAAFPTVGTDNIEGLPGFQLPPSPPFPPPPTLTFSPLSMTSGTNVSYVGDDTFQPIYAVSGNKFLVTSFTGSDVFTLSALANGFGTFIVQAGDAANVSTITFRLENTFTSSSVDVPAGTFGPGAGDNNVFFFGVSSTTPFNRVTVLNTNPGDGILYDNVSVGIAAVPEPTTYALIGLVGLVGYGRYRYMKRQQRKNEGR